ncbi:hypothetical protein CALVIDRAFT_560683 [Calocera viscosa TUFC12733]|uniref:Proteasomal ATPase second OB domain-containing protein n=1 Tax=Calocera viscosa (strain TUFC12733) TaxID=1330018 RepID=A0A167QMQ9_CALVF|nr:hypothetical protein CALVIDRAFT_560683 [Calocera viscosa TUFC12733]
MQSPWSRFATYTREQLDPSSAGQGHAPRAAAQEAGYADAYEGLCHMLDSLKISLALSRMLILFEAMPAYSVDEILCRLDTLLTEYSVDRMLCRPNTWSPEYLVAQILRRPNTSSPKYFVAQILRRPNTQSTEYSVRKRHADGQNKDCRHKKPQPKKWEPSLRTRVGKKKKRGPDAATKLPAVYPTTSCRLKLLKMERIKDYLLLEEELMQNQERLKPSVTEDKNEEERTRVDDLRGSPMGVGSLQEIIDDVHAIISTASGPEYYVSIMSFVDKALLGPGCTVLLHHKTSAVIGVLQDDTDPMVNLMKLDKAPTKTIAQPAQRFGHPRRRDGHHVDQRDGAKTRALVGRADTLARGDWRIAKGRALVGRADGLDLVKVQTRQTYLLSEIYSYYTPLLPLSIYGRDRYRLPKIFSKSYRLPMKLLSPFDCG